MKHNLYALTLLVALAAGSQPVAGQTRPMRNTNTAAIQEKLAAMGTHAPAVAGARGGGPANDECADALVLTSGTECVPTSSNTGGATESLPAATCTGFVSDLAEDVWFSFVATAPATVIEITGSGTDTDGYDAVLEAFSGPCTDLTSLGCVDATLRGETETLTLPTIEGNTYYFRCYYFAYTAAQTVFDLTACVFSAAPPPDNDECDNSIVLPVNNSCTPISATALGATQSLAPITCNGFTSATASDVWFSFVATGPLTLVTTEGVGNYDMVLEGFAGVCGDLVSVSCADATFTVDENIETVAIATNIGDTYYVRVYAYTNPLSVDFDFTICAFNPSNVPANDQCDGATVDALAVGGSVTWTGDNTGALDTEGLGIASVWHAFTTTECTNVTIAYCGMTVPFLNVGIRLYVDCPFSSFIGNSSVNFTDCGDDNATIGFDVVPAGTYYYAVLVGADATGAYEITVTAEACAPAPANDACANAQALLVSLACNPTDGSTEAGDQSLEPIECNTFTSLAAIDVWYSFVATGTDHTVTATGTNGADLVIELFSGACGSATSLACADATVTDGVEEIIQSGLTVGETYYVRVYNYGGTATFNICVTGDTPSSILDAGRAAAAFSVFPNPSNGDMTIRFGAADSKVAIELYDVAGRAVHQEQRQLFNGQQVDLGLAGKLAQGVYTLRLTTSSGRSEQRVVVR